MINFISSLNSTSGALDAERTRLEIISQNIANANTTRGLDGRAYHRQQVVFETMLQRARTQNGGTESMSVPHVSRVMEDPRLGQAIYQPGHPDADPNGMVQLPNVNLYEEIADMIVASRTYDANVAVFKNSRSLAVQALSIGKR